MRTFQESMITCVEVLYELHKIDITKRDRLLFGVTAMNDAAYIEVTNLLTLLEKEV